MLKEKLKIVKKNIRKKLLLGFTYSLDSTSDKYICVGIDPTRNFETVIDLFDNKMLDGVKFSISEWHEFLTYHDMFESHIRNCDNKDSHLYQFVNHNLIFDSTDNLNVVIIETIEGKISLSLSSTKNLFHFNYFIDSIIIYLNSLNFGNYYINIINEALTIPGDLISNINGLTTYHNLNNIAMKEYLLYYSDILLNKLITLNYLQ